MKLWQVRDDLIINMDLVTAIANVTRDMDETPMLRIIFVDDTDVSLVGDDREKFLRCVMRETFAAR